MILGRALCVVVLLLLPVDFGGRADWTASAAPNGRPDRTILTGTIGNGDTLASAVDGVLSPAAVHELVEAARKVHDLGRVSVGHAFGVAKGPGEALAAFTYAIDELRTLRVLRRPSGTLEPELLSRQYETRLTTVGGTITSSLFGAVNDAGEEDQLALDLAEIFAWDVDFHTEIQKGDAFRVAVEKLSLDGSLRRYGRIFAAEFVRGERTLRAVRFEAAAGTGYYAPDGTPLRKAFLKSPLRFTRISSGFTNARFHPILGKFAPHLGVDYAAPTGTPVQSAGDGVVSLAGWLGGFGNTVKVRHANGFETLYGHLSRIGVRNGQRVSQGQTIGNVGTTGLATGPHLDYRMLRNGAYVNPLRVQSPPAPALDAVERPAFSAVAERGLALLAPMSDSAVRTASLVPAPGAPPKEDSQP